MRKSILFVLTILLLTALMGCGNTEGKSEKDDKNAIVLKVSDYGAVGDGKTDDSVAIDTVLDMAKMKGRDGAPVVIEFEKDKSYYFADMNSEKAIFTLDSYKNLTVRGDNTTLILDRTKQTLVHWFRIDGCENIKLEGFNLKWAKDDYSLAKVDAVSLTDAPYIDVTTESSLGITETFVPGYVTEGGTPFAMPYTEEVSRMHIIIKSIEPLDTVANKYRIHVNPIDNHETKINYVVEHDIPLIVGIPGWARYGEDDGSGSVVVVSTENIELERINVWDSAGMVFHMRYNTGTVHVHDCNVTSEPGTDDLIASWRDIFHLKDNRAKFIIEDCVLEKAWDDVFNFSVTEMEVTEAVSENEAKMSCVQTGGYWSPLKVGDTVTFVHVKSGYFIGRTRIKEVISQGVETHLVLEDKMPMLGVGVSVYVDSLGQPGSIIRNCKVNGTYRFRSEVTIEDCELNTLYAWIDNHTGKEGPIPRNITFKRCKFNSIKADDPNVSFMDPTYMMQIGAMTKGSDTPAYYYADNIVFEDCDIDHTLINFMNDSANVSFIKDGKEYFSVKAKSSK